MEASGEGGGDTRDGAGEDAGLGRSSSLSRAWRRLRRTWSRSGPEGEGSSLEGVGSSGSGEGGAGQSLQDVPLAWCLPFASGRSSEGLGSLGEGEEREQSGGSEAGSPRMKRQRVRHLRRDTHTDLAVPGASVEYGDAGLSVCKRPRELGLTVTGFWDGVLKHVERVPGKVAIRWFDDDGKEAAAYTYQEVFDTADAIALKLQKWGAGSQDRLMLISPPGIDFIFAFLGCLRAGVVAVPAYPPSPERMERDIGRLAGIIKSAGPKFALTSNTYLRVKRLTSFRYTWPKLDWHATTSIRGKPGVSPRFEAPQMRPEDLAFLQFTSGSTGDPKGVMVSHQNLNANLEVIMCASYEALELHGHPWDPDEIAEVSWLPQYHDMGLIASYLCNLVIGSTGYYMSPITFIKRPSG